MSRREGAISNQKYSSAIGSFIFLPRSGSLSLARSFKPGRRNHQPLRVARATVELMNHINRRSRDVMNNSPQSPCAEAHG
jgi:hypothetical protein